MEAELESSPAKSDRKCNCVIKVRTVLVHLNLSQLFLINANDFPSLKSMLHNTSVFS